MTEPGDTPEDGRIGDLYRRTATEEPTVELDRAVLAAARAAVTRRRYRSPVPWAVAATLVLGVGIGWQLLQFSRVQVLPASTPTLDATHEARDQAAPPVPQRGPADGAAPAGAPVKTAPEWMLRESMPAARAPAEADHAVRSKTIAPAASPPAEAAECEGYELAEDAPLRDLREAIEAAQQSADRMRALCLERQLRQRESSSALPAGIPRSESDE